MLMGAIVRIRKDDDDSDIITYHFMSQRWFFTHASPTLSNAGIPRLQVSDTGLVLFFYKLQLFFLHWWIFLLVK